ncbi:MAG TPA: ankyrin repeat domain-containing protein [Mycobacteriales bacterium]|nr:ankyrin repeat domain-containing protein [Mycobacteriales bacterium]
MPTLRLPDDPSIAHLRRLARRLQRSVRTGDRDAVALVARYRFEPGPSFALSAAQLVVARECGFASWPVARAQLERLAEFRRDPDATPASADPADDYCRLACLVYSGDDGPDRWAAAVVSFRPALAEGSVFAAAAAGDAVALAAHLDADPGAASRPGGPYGWEPLLYLTYSRVPQADPLRAATLLLDAGADPDAGYAWHGLTPPFTALTGVFGEGEQGPGRQPRHPRSLELGRLLLAAGADPNDGQTLYNRMFVPDDDFLPLLFEYGLGREASGVWRQRLGGALETPAEMLARPLTWAAAHGFTERVRLLLGHGVDPDAVSPEGRALSLAAAAGHREIVALLLAAGATPITLSPVDALVAAVLAGDEDGVDPAVLPAALAARPGLVAEAVDAGADPGLAVRLGFPVSAPADGQTALHTAAWAGSLELARRLVELGADLDARDDRFGGRPVDWAVHAHHPELVTYLRAAEPALAPDSPEPGGSAATGPAGGSAGTGPAVGSAGSGPAGGSAATGPAG